MRLRSAVFRAILQQNATVLIYFGTGMVIARLLTPHAVGAYAVAMAFVNFALALKDSGLGAYVVSNADIDEMLLRLAFGLTLLISTVLTAVFAALSWPVATFYGDPALGQVLRIVAMAQIPSALAFPATVQLMRALRFDVLLVVGVIGVACQSATAITLAFAGESTAALGWGYLVGTIVTAAATVVARPETIRLRPALEQWRELFSFGTWVSATMMVANAGAALPELMIGRALGLGNAALFSRAQNIVSIIRNGFSYAVMRPMLPRITECEHDGRGMSGISLQVMRHERHLFASHRGGDRSGVASLCGPGCLGRAVDPTDLWSGMERRRGLIAPLAIAHGLTLAVAPNWEVLIVKRRVRLLFTCEVGLLLAIAALVGTGLVWGVREAAWGLVVAQAVFAAVNSTIMKFVTGFSTRALLAAWARSLAIAASMATAAALFRLIGAQSPVGILLEVAGSGALCTLVWIVGLRITRHELHHHVDPVVSALVASAASRLINRPAAPRPLEKAKFD